jgi:hypothetical protein
VGPGKRALVCYEIGVEASPLPPGRSRETKIRRDAAGRWFNDGVPITHPKLRRAFDAWIDRADDGRYCLKNEINWAYVTIEGPPLFVRDVSLDGGVTLELSDGTRERLEPSTLREGTGGALYCEVRGGGWTARFDRESMQKLEPILDEDDEGIYLAIEGRRVRPQKTEEP